VLKVNHNNITYSTVATPTRRKQLVNDREVPAETTNTQTVTKFVSPHDMKKCDTSADLQSYTKAIHLEALPVENMIKLTVNRRPYQLQVEPNWPLRDVLREKLGLTSIKDFCNGYGACGSCTVIMDGRPVLSCTILAIECDGAVIETAEGIAEAKHPLVEAYIMNWTAQCGYCTPGFLVTAKALLDHNSDPTEDEIKEALSGNLCRCGTYPVQVKAIREAAKKLRGEKSDGRRV
jgi:aerobic-type carbon monoxide dehydrogenase small subunit (CoxS/CutS family)